jgi:hypothetical protein
MALPEFDFWMESVKIDGFKFVWRLELCSLSCKGFEFCKFSIVRCGVRVWGVVIGLVGARPFALPENGGAKLTELAWDLTTVAA